MSDINKIKINNESPTHILRDGPIIELDGDALWTWLKWANDAGGYYVHGLTILPTTGWGPYTWPWDLGVPNGALKDDNHGYARWGYVNDGLDKNLSNGMRADFPANVSGSHDVCICICNETVATQGISFGKVPIVITFLDDRFDDAEWIVNKDAKVNIDGRTITIRSVPKDDRGLVLTARWQDRTLENARIKMKNIKANVSGLTYHKAIFTKPTDLSSGEIWKLAKGDTIIYNKDKTFENCYKKYNYITETTDYSGKYKGYSISNVDKLSQGVSIPLISDIDNYLQNNSNISDNFITFNTPINNPKLEEYLRNWLETHTIDYNIAINFLRGSNIDGELTFTLNKTDRGDFFFGVLSDFLNGTKVRKININSADPDAHTIGSLNNLFKGATYLEEITSNQSFRASDCSGCFEFCGNLKSYPANLVDWSRRSTDPEYPSVNNILYCFEYCHIKHIPGNYTILCGIFSDLFLNGCSATTIDPIIDVGYVDPSNGAKYMFTCSTLESVKIKRLNHGDWNLDGLGTIINGELFGLNKASVDYLFENLVDLNTHIDGKCDITSDNSFRGWKYPSNKYITNKDIVYAPYSTSYGNMIVSRESTFNNIGFNISFDDTFIEAIWDDGGTITLLVNGVNILSHVNEGLAGFKVRLKNSGGNPNNKSISITFVDPCDYANPKVTSANLYCPSLWEDKIDDNMIASANLKGWNIYIGRVLKEPTNI